MRSAEIKNNVNKYIKSAIENVEYGMNVIECDNDFNNAQNKEIDNIYQKLSNAIKILEDIDLKEFK